MVSRRMFFSALPRLLYGALTRRRDSGLLPLNMLGLRLWNTLTLCGTHYDGDGAVRMMMGGVATPELCTTYPRVNTRDTDTQRAATTSLYMGGDCASRPCGGRLDANRSSSEDSDIHIESAKARKEILTLKETKEDEAPHCVNECMLWAWWVCEENQA